MPDKDASIDNEEYQKACERIKSNVRSIPDWPIKGVIFRDITTLLQDPATFKEICDLFYNRYAEKEIDKIVGIDARGFRQRLERVGAVEIRVYIEGLPDFVAAPAVELRDAQEQQDHEQQACNASERRGEQVCKEVPLVGETYLQHLHEQRAVDLQGPHVSLPGP